MIKLALLGCGKWGKNYLKTLTLLAGCELTWVCDPDPAKLKEAASLYPKIQTTPNKEDILNDRSIQGVVIAVPPASHYALARECIGHGKAVLVEKPVTIDRRDTLALIRLAAAQNVTFMAGFTLLYHPAVAKLKETITENHLLDEPCYLNMARTNPVSRFCGADIVHDLAVHDIYLSRAVIGRNPIWVSAQGGCHEKDRGDQVIYILLGFPKGQIVSIFASFIHPEKTRIMTLATAAGKVIFDDSKPVDQKIRLIRNGGNQFLPLTGSAAPLEAECRHFLACIQEGKEPDSGKKSIAYVAKITDCISTSLKKNGKKVFIHWDHGAWEDGCDLYSDAGKCGQP